MYGSTCLLLLIHQALHVIINISDFVDYASACHTPPLKDLAMTKLSLSNILSHDDVSYNFFNRVNMDDGDTF